MLEYFGRLPQGYAPAVSGSLLHFQFEKHCTIEHPVVSGFAGIGFMLVAKQDAKPQAGACFRDPNLVFKIRSLSSMMIAFRSGSR